MSDELTEIPGINTSLRKTPIAIIGMAAIFPQAENLQMYWDNIINEVDCITDVPPSRWNIEDYYDPDPKVPDKTYCKRGGFIPDIDFNPMEFGLPPNILEVTDVSQLLSLVVAKEAIKDAGYGNRDYNRAKTGVILGVGGGQKLITPLTTRLQYPIWEKALKSSGIAKEDREKIIEKIKLAYIPWEENSFPGMLGNVIAGRIANRLDLGGVNCVVDAACAASLAAVKMAVSELVEHRCDTMITGGVDTDNSIFMYMSFSKTPAFSKQQEIRPFGVDSDGMMIGEGVGMLVLKRLEDAERDNDRIYAVIKGIGTSSDGKYKSIYAPRSSGQAMAVDRAYQDAGFPPASVDLIEAHGTGTPAGDPTEFAGLNEVFSQKNPKKQHVALGSVKSQIGHTKSAAGTASLIKTALALHHKILPPTLNVSRPNPKLDIENSPFYLNTETRPWIRAQSNSPRRAGVSAFGFGGTNFHFVLEEYDRDHNQAYRLHTAAQSIFLTAQTSAHLLIRCEEQLTLLQSEAGEQHYAALLESLKILNMPVTSARVGFVAESLAEAIEFLQITINLLQQNEQTESWEHPKGIYYRQTGIIPEGKVVALFPGQGSQYLEMGKELALNFPSLRQAFGQIDNLFIADQQKPLSNIVFPKPGFDPAEKAAQAKTLEQTKYAQPAIGAFSFGLYKLLQQAGFSPDFVAGHSFGELTALWAAGVINDEDYIFLMKARGQAMAPPSQPDFDTGTMLAVKGDAEQLQVEVKNLTDVTVANLNSKQQVILAGPTATMRNTQQYLEAKGYHVTPLSVSAAFHTPLVGHAQKPFAQAIERTTFRNPGLSVYANSSGQPYPNKPRTIQITLEEHILKPVLFQQEIENIYAAGGAIFVEIGPKNVLTNLVKNILGDKPHLAVALNANSKKGSDRQLREAYVQLCVAGLPLRPIDPYPIKFESANSAAHSGKKSILNVKLNGNNYVSQKTQAAFETALQDGHKITSAILESTPLTASIPMPSKAQVTNANVPQTTKTSGESQAPLPASKPLKVAPPLPTIKSQSIPAAEPVSPAPVQAKVKSMSQSIPTPSQQTPQTSEVKGQPQNQTTHKTQQLSPLHHRRTVSPSLESLEQSIALLHRHQAETLRIHEEYLKNQEEYSKSIFQLMQQHYATLPAEYADSATHLNEGYVQSSSVTVPEARSQDSVVSSLSAPISPISPEYVPNNDSQLEAINQPAETILVPAIEPTKPFTPDNVSQPKQVDSPVKTTPAVATPAPAASTNLVVEALAQTMLEVVSEKTGYPAEMLELEMDMEADLGIDSIKRVEILGAMQERYPDLPAVNPEELAELRTLGQIVDHMQTQPNSTAISAPPAPVQPVAVTPSAPVPVEATTIDELAQAMLDVVSEKTGYPAEMLELEMDMEADLGIDSIKRVEILGAMQERYPNLPPVNPEELAELRMLGQIVDHMQPQTNDTPTILPVQPINEASSSAASLPPHPNGNGASPPVAVDVLSQAMLDVVSEKTGYPAEMLELEMDMEADLGIDSIKRVEILGAMQERYPDLPPVNPEELAELRTLGQIVDHMQVQPNNTPTILPIQSINEASSSAASLPPHTNGNGASPPIAVDVLSQAMLDVVSEKTGYPAEMLELEMDMEADLGIDSIKRVEILGAMQERYPDLPPVNPEDLAELRTLGGIVDFLGKSEPAIVEAATTVVVATPTMVGTQNGHNLMPALPDHTIARNLVRLKTLAAPDFLEFTLPDNYICLLTDDGSPTTATVAQSLIERGWKVVVLSFPATIIPKQSSLPTGIERITLEDMSETHLQQQLAAISTNFGSVGAFIHLHPADRDNRIFEDYESDPTKAIIKHIFFIAKHLKPSLNEAAQQQRACFLTVTHLDGEFGLSGELDFNPIDGGLFGLTKTLNLEWNQVFCRAIDLHPDLTSEQATQCILAELHDPNLLIVEVGYGHKGRTTLVAEEESTDVTRSHAERGNKSSNPKPVLSEAEVSKIQNPKSAVFVVSGGAKGITAQCVIRLAQQYHCKFILLGRSSITDVDTSWVGDYANEATLKRLIMENLLANGEKPTPVKVQQVARAITSKQEIEATLQTIRQAGGQAQYLSVDVTDASALQHQLAAAAQQLGPITGIIHGAGVLSDKLIEKKLDQDFEAVYSAKVQGLQALLKSVPSQQLEHLVLFSSAAGFYGNVGQADYALANDILNKTAYLVKRQHPACHVVSINWGPWDGGMVTPALKQFFAEQNIEVIPVDVGTWLLANELTPANHNVVQTVVGGPLSVPNDAPDATLRTYRVHRFLSLEANPFLNDHIIGGYPVLPTVSAIAWMGNVCEQLYPGYKMFSCDNYQVLKGIVFNGDSIPSKEYIVDLEEVAKTDAEVTFKAVVWSTTPDNKPRYHYRAKITLLQTLPDAPIYDAFDNSETQPMLRAELYQNGTLFHGLSFQGVERVLNISPQKVTMRCALPEIADTHQGQFRVQSFNPFIADGQFQSMVIWARHFHQAGSLPLQTRRGEQYRPIPFGETSYVSMEVKDSTDTKLVADIITHDAQGQIYARVLGAEVTISKQLNHLFVPATQKETSH